MCQWQKSFEKYLGIFCSSRYRIRWQKNCTQFNFHPSWVFAHFYVSFEAEVSENPPHESHILDIYCSDGTLISLKCIAFPCEDTVGLTRFYWILSSNPAILVATRIARFSVDPRKAILVATRIALFSDDWRKGNSRGVEIYCFLCSPVKSSSRILSRVTENSAILVVNREKQFSSRRELQISRGEFSNARGNLDENCCIRGENLQILVSPTICMRVIFWTFGILMEFINIAHSEYSSQALIQSYFLCPYERQTRAKL